VREKLGDVEGAAFDYEKALELDPSDAITHNNLGMIFEKKGRPQQANHHFKWADTLQGLNGAEIWNNEQDGPASPTAEENQPMPLPWWKEMWRPITEKKERQAFWRWVKTRKSSN
jgi:tetratricopeptide (TPR) repeat protein